MKQFISQGKVVWLHCEQFKQMKKTGLYLKVIIRFYCKTQNNLFQDRSDKASKNTVEIQIAPIFFHHPTSLICPVPLL